MRLEPSERNEYLYKRGSRKIPWPFHHIRTQWEGTKYELGRTSPEGSHPGTLILDFPVFKIVNSKFLLYISYPVSGILLIVARTDHSTSHFSKLQWYLRKKILINAKIIFRKMVFTFYLTPFGIEISYVLHF